MSRRLSASFGRLPAGVLLAACLAAGVAVADPAGQAQPTNGAAAPSASPPSSSPPSSNPPAPSAPPAGTGTVTPAPDAAGTTPAPTTPAPSGSAAAASTAKPSPQVRATLSQVEKRITDLHEKLHITAAQQPLWDGFAETMRQNARDMDAAAEQRRHGAESMTALADMQSYADIAQMHAAQMSRLVSSFAVLYNAMPDDQKKQADAAFKAFQSQASAGRRPG